MRTRSVDAWSRCGIALVLCLCLGAVGSAAKGSSHGSSGKTVHVKEYTKKDGTKVAAHHRQAPHSTPTTPRASTPNPSTDQPKSTAHRAGSSVARDSHGRIERSEAAKRSFEQQTGYPRGRPGYVVDHIIPLACGGADAPGNMQWQTIADAKAKDKTERLGCR